MKKRVCFVDPPGLDKGLNLGLGYLCAAIIQKRRAVAEVFVYDFHNSREPFEEKVRKISGYDLVGISIKSYNAAIAAEIARRVKKDNKLVVGGGVHVTIMEEEFLRENPEFDIGVIGEADETILDLVDYVAGKKRLANIPGIVYRENGKIKKTSARSFVKNIDDLPFPEYACFDSVNMKAERPIDLYMISTSRGCPYSCTYCVAGKSVGKVWRPRSIENVMQELMQVKKKFNPVQFNIVDDNFTLNVDRAKKICKAMIEHKLGVELTLNSGIRADHVDEELLSLFKQSGVDRLIFGVESGNELVFKAINKGESLDDIKKAIAMTKKASIKVAAFFIIGLPYSNCNRDNESLRFAKQLNLDKAVWSLLVPYPGTPAFEWVEKNGKWLGDWRGASALRFEEEKENSIVFDTTDYPAEQRIELFKKANIQMHNYPAIFRKGGIAFNALRTACYILRYDFANIFSHIWFLLNYAGVVQNYIRRNAQ